LNYERLLAKSERKGTRPSRAQTIRYHTDQVMKVAGRLVDTTGRAQLGALGLDAEEWLARFRRDIKVAALLHDLGKANSHFQEMVHDPLCTRIQGLRHEAVSFLIAQSPAVREWVKPALSETRSVELILWSVAGHHRKFPPVAAPEGSGASMRVFLEHRDFRRTLELGEADPDLRLGPPPAFEPGHGLTRLRLTSLDGIFREFLRARREAAAVWDGLGPEERRYVAALKACLICADVAGSIGRRGEEPMTEWLALAFSRVPTAGQVDLIIAGKLGGAELREFQKVVGRRSERVVFARAGCGTGKTVAAYEWARRQWPGRRVFFCYPTTGTATEGYRDYLVGLGPVADLIHGRAEVDKDLLGLVESAVEPDMSPPLIGDDEADRVAEEGARGRKEGASEDSAGALEQWSTALVSCTVDTVLGLVQNNRRGLYAWPSIAGAACVFDEIHSYDDALFDALLRFLADVPGVPCLLMTASLPDDRRRRLEEVLTAGRPEGFRQPLAVVDGPADLEVVRRYRRDPGTTLGDAWGRAREVYQNGGKVLWVVNTVNTAMALAGSRDAAGLGARLYHSRFRYRDRVDRHREVIEAFRGSGAAFAITTQVAEMSLDLSADLLVTELAPIPALIQRLGRLNRRATADDRPGPQPFLVLEPESHLPYSEAQLVEARGWLAALGPGPLSQRDLTSKWEVPEYRPEPLDRQVVWLDGGFVTQPRPLRESSPGIEVILGEDAVRLERWRELPPEERVRPEEVRIPMPPVPRGLNWRGWPQVAFCHVPPDDCITYDPRKGAEWTTR
jgi:CRISPR-associated endonuclease/helicase Cas3